MAAIDSAAVAAAALVREMERVQRLHRERVANPIMAGALDRLALWQSRRLSMTYADLAVDRRYTAAIVFFENDLYGTADYARRDADLARIVPIILRVVPAGIVAAIALATELNALSQELDRALLARLPHADGHFTVAEYCKAYRRAGNIPLRRRQVQLIVEVGLTLDRYVGRRMLRSALAMMRQPANLANLSSLHEFLERGFGAFGAMRGAGVFLDTINERETAILESIVAGSNDPFGDPLLWHRAARMAAS